MKKKICILKHKSDEVFVENASNRHVYLDVLRIIATFSVIFTHTSTKGFFLFSCYSSHSFHFWLYMSLTVLSRYSVPLFFMISGTLLLGRTDESIGKLWKDRILKILCSLFFFSVFYYIDDMIKAGQQCQWNEFLIKLYTGKTKYHLWYLYSYIAYLICLPFLRSMSKGLNAVLFRYLVVIVVVILGIIPVLQYLLGQDSVTISGQIIPGWLGNTYILYPCLGYYLGNDNNSEKPIISIPTAWVASFIGVAISCYLTYYKAQITGVLEQSQSQVFFDSFVVFECIAIFISVKKAISKCRLPVWVIKVIYTVGKSTFGVYLIHAFVIGLPVMGKLLNTLLSLGMNDMLAVLLYCMIVLIVGSALTIIVSKIPILKKTVGY